MAAFLSMGVVAFIFGAVLVLIALIGGGIEIREAHVPEVTRNTRIVAAVVGLAFIGLGIWFTIQGQESGTKVVTAPTNTSQAATTTSEAPFPTDRERILLSHVPEEFRVQCVRSEQLYTNASVGVKCTPSITANAVWYYEFNTVEQMNAWYFSLVDNKNIARNSGSCQDDQVSEGTYSRNDIDVGHLACYRDGATAWVIWTYSKLGIAGLAYRADLDLKVLYEWWRDGAGPLDPEVS
jgi:regulator of protease activity HflC (stomatin/prohibitin superfamily)